MNLKLITNIISKEKYKIIIMGNMSNPLINRWGSNLFWYNFWYTDKNINFSINLDRITEELISIYINFGLFFKKNIFFNYYWFFKKCKTFENSINKYDNNYFRVMEYKNKVTNELTKFTNRLRIKKFYSSKLWILKYQQWLIINLYAFQSIIKRRRIKKIKKINVFPLQQKIITNYKTNNKLNILRLKILISFFINNFINFNNTYYFF